MISPKNRQRLILGAKCLLSYLVAILLTLTIFGVVSLRSGHFDWEVLGIVAAFFPAGLFVLFTNSEGPWIILGYAVYIALLGLSIAFARRLYLWCLLVLLLLNISGCCHVLWGLEQSGWAE